MDFPLLPHGNNWLNIVQKKYNIYAFNLNDHHWHLERAIYNNDLNNDILYVHQFVNKLNCACWPPIKRKKIKHLEKDWKYAILSNILDSTYSNFLNF